MIIRWIGWSKMQIQNLLELKCCIKNCTIEDITDTIFLECGHFACISCLKGSNTCDETLTYKIIFCLECNKD